MLVFAASIIALFSFAMLTIALRGRRIDDHPLCRKCGYDLTGRSAGNTKCSECGRDLKRRNAIRVGHRVHHRRLAAIAFLLLLSSSGTAGTIEYFQHRYDNWMEHAPVWVLRYELKNTGPKQLPALAELQARLNRHQLAQSQVNAIADKCLSVQADQSVPWLAAWGDFVETARSAHQLDDARWSTYATQAPDLAIIARPAAVAGNSIPVEPTLKSSRLSKACFIAYVTIQSATLDGKPVLAEDLRGGRVWINGKRIMDDSKEFHADMRFAVPGRYSNELLDGNGHCIDEDLSATLATGSRALTVDYLFYMVESDSQYGYKPFGKPRGGVAESMPDDIPLEKTHPVGSKTCQASCTFNIYPAGQMPDLMTAAELDHAISQCMHFNAVAGKSGRTTLHWIIKDFPGQIDFHVYIRTPDRKLEEPKAMFHPMYRAKSGQWDSDDDELSSAFDHAEKLDVILRPNVQKSRESGVEMKKTWDEDIVIKDIPVERK